MYVAMNHFQVAANRGAEFEDQWRRRESYLDDVPGFRSFHLVRGQDNRGRHAQLRIAHDLGGSADLSRLDAFRGVPQGAREDEHHPRAAPGTPGLQGLGSRSTSSGHGQRQPAEDEAGAADRRDRAQPSCTRERHHVEATREEHDPGEEQPARRGDPTAGACARRATPRPAASAWYIWYRRRSRRSPADPG